jgi:hypothetical protein
MPEAESYLVFYANSRELARVTGILRVGPINGTFSVGFEATRGQYVRGKWIPAGGIVLVDPRCVTWDDQDRMVYNPREHVTEMDRSLRRWLDEHPRWPPKRRPEV